jgi:F0F1-type ATP synthase assembly protein I
VPPSRSTRFIRAGALAFDFTGTILGGAACGWLVDRWLDTEPWGLTVLSVVGVVGGFVRLVQLLRRFEKADAAKHP